jgi:hypothetical protein
MFRAVYDDTALRTDQMSETGTLATLVIGVVTVHGTSVLRVLPSVIYAGGQRKSACIDVSSAAPGHSDE